MEVRNARYEDLPAISAIYDRARSFMRQTGNPNQWGSINPPLSKLEADLAARQLYVLEEGGKICGVFAFVIGEDPTYRVIDGAWHSDQPYGTIHRIASSGEVPGVFAACMAFCEKKARYLRIDTHEQNLIMRHLIEKHGFQPCGVIHVADGSPRFAYDKR